MVVETFEVLTYLRFYLEVVRSVLVLADLTCDRGHHASLAEVDQTLKVSQIVRISVVCFENVRQIEAEKGNTRWVDGPQFLCVLNVVIVEKLETLFFDLFAVLTQHFDGVAQAHTSGRIEGPYDFHDSVEIVQIE